MENTVENERLESTADDALNETMPEDESEPIMSAFDEAEETPNEETRDDEEPVRSEPGWIRKRVDKAVAKAVAEAEQRVSAQYEQRFAPLMERMLEQDAKELVQQGEFKSLDRAKEYLKLKGGYPVSQIQQPQSAPQITPEVTARANILAKQAAKIKDRRGLDVVAEFNTNPETRQKVVSGEWDFYDVADSLDADEKPKQRRAPAPMRTPNGASGAEKSSIASMSDEQFSRLEKKIAEGGRYSV